MSIVSRENLGSVVTFSMKVFYELKPGMIQTISTNSQNGYLSSVPLSRARAEHIEEINGSPSDDSTNVIGRSDNRHDVNAQLN